MGFLLQIVSIGSISVITFLALYTALIFMINFIQKKKDTTKYFNKSRTQDAMLLETQNYTTNSF